MGSDRARRSYDSSKAYRGVVMQQGRAFVEADWNEQQEIVSEEMMRATLDIVGPAGVVGDGFKVEFEHGKTDDFKICAGTAYVGGMRVALDGDLTYRDHADASNDLDDRECVGTDLVYLEVTEQEVSAAEDTELKDAALGGPDTAQRVRLIPRIRRHPVEAKSCEEAVQELRTYWDGHGLVWNPHTMRLHSRAQLQVAFDKLDDDKETEASVSGVYLRNENQLIRVQVTGHAKDVTGYGGTLAWGYNNASDLYRITVATVKKSTGSDDEDEGKDSVRLESRPVDVYHQPVPGQTVEILRTIGYLANGEPIAASHGHITAVDTKQKYDPDSRTLLLGDKLPADYVNDDRPLFLRIWEENKEFVAGSRVALRDTGLFVTLGLTMDADSGGFQVGDFWLISVRPGTPTIIYPGRILKEPQPPDGPRRWICALARIDWDGGDGPRLHDCRHRIQDLVSLANEPRADAKKEIAETGRCCCCNVMVTPKELKDGESMRSILKKSKTQHATVCLLPGEYLLESPLRLGGADSGVTLRGCGAGVLLKAKGGCEDRFLDGLIVLDGAADVTLENLNLSPPIVPISAANGQLAGLSIPTFYEVFRARVDNLRGSIGLRLVNASNATVDGCVFDIPADDSLFAVGILAGGECSGLKLRHSRFERKAERKSIEEEGYDISMGFAAVPSMTLATDGLRNIVKGDVLATRLASAEVQGNSFANLDAAVLVYANVGEIVVRENEITECHAGVWLLAARSLPFFDAIAVGDVTVDTGIPRNQTYTKQTASMYSLLKSAYIDPVVRRGLTLARIYPLPDAPDRTMASHDRLPDAVHHETIEALMRKGLSALLSTLENAAILERVVVKDQGQPALSDLKFFDRLLRDLAGVERAYHDGKDPLSLTLQAEGNRIISTKADVSRTGLLVWDDADDQESMATVTGNIVRMRSGRTAAVMILGIYYAAVSGNVLLNNHLAGHKQVSLVYYGGTVGIVTNA